MVWRNSSLFAEERARIEAMGGRAAELSRCGMCLVTQLCVLWLGLPLVLILSWRCPSVYETLLIILASPSIGLYVLQRIEVGMRNEELDEDEST